MDLSLPTKRGLRIPDDPIFLPTLRTIELNISLSSRRGKFTIEDNTIHNVDQMCKTPTSNIQARIHIVDPQSSNNPPV